MIFGTLALTFRTAKAWVGCWPTKAPLLHQIQHLCTKRQKALTRGHTNCFSTKTWQTQKIHVVSYLQFHIQVCFCHAW